MRARGTGVQTAQLELAPDHMLDAGEKLRDSYRPVEDFAVINQVGQAISLRLLFVLMTRAFAKLGEQISDAAAKGGDRLRFDKILQHEEAIVVELPLFIRAERDL